ncbi:MAG: acetyl-CoA carboxylase biotin carboxylase subunit [Planctomycetota bacterium]|nr:acetyl-CoA carboxylase biotin carboxylase subunit [Planctomycetota bacterium]MCX8040473.1 acetyl-CoA carboxylase biotin carboxylase subunit [Planctomycetota bacterium]MDW8373221.1 acetyl-CoA carboxylase biotin carboxylase subunit [Planctomycetota bacterium]
MFKRILIANRGEIAVRIIKTCRRLGIETCLVYSTADRESLGVKLADIAICIGPPQAKASYLNINNIIAAAELADVDAIHPGFGFLAENSHFAQVVRDCQIEFIGPTSAAMDALGNKAKAKTLAHQTGVPTVPGSTGPVKGQEEAIRIAREIGYPVLIKATAGGGGRGMRVAHNDASLVSGLIAAQREAEAAFGCGDCIIEAFVQRARHIEIQVIGDKHGNLVALGERDCSTQRRHQKLVEESPSPVITPETRARMCADAVALARAAGYHNAGTVEFIYDLDRKAYYFLEMNTRIQVEHPVTEMVTDLDLIELMIRVAAGEPLPFRQEDVRPRGHAIEVRINAEDWQNGFAPAPGKLALYVPPSGKGVRVDSHCYTGYVIPPHYDSMIAKLIVHGADRSEALRILDRALAEYYIEGVKTTLGFHQRLIRDPRFVNNEVTTKWVDEVFCKA